MYRAWEEVTPSSLGNEETPATQPATQLQYSQSQPTPLDDDESLIVARLQSMDSQIPSIDLEIGIKPLILGRKPTCNICLDDPTVSGTHCRIYYDDNVPLGSVQIDDVLEHAVLQNHAQHLTSPGFEPSKAVDRNGEVFYGASHFWIEDVSSNGTYVNMVKIGRNCRARLCHNDVVSLCRPDAKKRTKGTKMTWLFTLTNPSRVGADAYPNAITLPYDIKQTIGTGAFSEVKLAVERSTQRMVAIKVLDKMKYTGGTRSGDQLVREVEILKQLSHPNIIHIVDVVDTSRMLFIVLELATGGELFEQIATKKRHTEEEARFLFKQILDAVQYLHAKNIVHRDIK